MDFINYKIIIIVILILILLFVFFLDKYAILHIDTSIEQFKDNYVYDKHPNHKFKTIRLIGDMNSTGLKQDLEIYNNLLQDSYILHNPNNDKTNEKYITRNINIHFEKIYENYLSLGNKNYFVPNQEYLYETPDTLQNIDIFLCKTMYASQLFTYLKKKYNLKGKIEFVGHTSIINNKNSEIIQTKNKNLFLHLAGKSPFKNTDLLISVWKKIHKKYPKNTLIISCRGNCKRMLFNNNCNECTEEKDGIIYKEYYDNLDFIQNSICCICPSLVEGFGHYINEGRANGCAIITVDGQPMNELVVNGKNGLLVKVDKIIDSDLVVYPHRKYFPFLKHFGKLFLNKIECDNSYAYKINADDLYNQIEKFILLDNTEKLRMCNNSRLMYIEDTKTFEQNILNNI